MTDARPSMRQGVIRQWARERNLAIGSRGRLPRSVVEAFQREKVTSAANDGHPQDSAQAAGSGFGPLEPLARYLEPRFGNIYDWDSTIVPYIAVDGFDVQPWTEEVRQAVKHYLLLEAPEPLLDTAFPNPEGARTEEWVDEALEGYQPWEVGLRFHEAAVALLPTLDALIGHLQIWPYEDDREDAEYWLEQHATESQLRMLAKASGQLELTQEHTTSDFAFHLLRQLEPPALLKAWHNVADHAPSDLTDTEWELLKPFVPVSYRYFNEKGGHEPRTRAILNGILYRFQEDCSWSGVPIRYGTQTVVYQRHYFYKRNGVFASMLAELQDNPEAARLVAWLRHEMTAGLAHSGNRTINT